MDEPIRRCRDLDERLTPYVDGEAGPDERRAVDAHLSKCPPCRGHADVERAARDVIHECRDELRRPAPEGLRARCAEASGVHLRAARPGGQAGRFHLPSSGLRRWVPLSLAATLLLAIGGVFFTGVNTRVEALATGLAVDHAKCFQFNGDMAAKADAEDLAEKWKRDQGWPLVMPASADNEQLKLLTVRRCLSTDGRVAHVMYRWRGQPLSVFVLPRATGREREDVLDAMGREVAIWSANGRTYAVLANDHPPDFAHIVNYVKTHAR